MSKQMHGRLDTGPLTRPAKPDRMGAPGGVIWLIFCLTLWFVGSEMGIMRPGKLFCFAIIFALVGILTIWFNRATK